MVDFPPWVTTGAQWGLVGLVLWVLLRVNADLRAALRAEQARNTELANQWLCALRSLRDALSPSRPRQR
jgi:hypothetical protein